MISKFTADVPRFHENLKYVVLPFTLSTADGKLSNFVVPNSSGFVIADTTQVPAGSPPHAAAGKVSITDGQARSALSIVQASIQMEEGTPAPDLWPGKVLGAIRVTGIDSAGRPWVGVSRGVAEGDERSLAMEWGVSDAPSALAGFNELAKWAGV